MLRSPLILAAAALTLGAAASAQQNATAKVLPATTAKNAGTYHVATGTWTRSKSPVAMLGTDVLYDNTCTIGFFIGLSSGESLVDSGRMPSPSSPTNSQSLTGSSITYAIDGFQMAYCTGEPAVDILVNFYQCYVPCADATALVPDASLTMLAMPGVAGGTGSLACWAVTVDLAATSQAFSMFADCDGTYDGVSSLDNFGWSWGALTVPASGQPQGPFLAGDPFGITTGTACPYGDGTFWSGNTNAGTGIGSDDVFETDLGGAMAGCWFFGGYLSGNPYSSFFMQVIGDAAGTVPPTGTQFCSADGSGTTACPCGNNNDGSNGLAGCANGANAGGASLTGTGSASVSNDTVSLQVAGADTNKPGLFFRADNEINGGNGLVFGDGLRCAGGNIVRLGVVITDGTGAGTSVNAMGTGLAAGDTKSYQFWYRNPFTSLCGAGFNLTNGYTIAWGI